MIDGGAIPCPAGTHANDTVIRRRILNSHRIVILMHEKDRHLRAGRQQGVYLVSALVPYWREMGHEVNVVYGPDDVPDADVAIVHVDLSVVPENYLRAAARCPVVVNGRVRDIRKRRVSTNLLERGDPWPGPVIVKTDLNNGGIPERLRRARQAVDEVDVRRLRLGGLNRYRIFQSLAAVPDAYFSDARLIVERFLPERLGDMYVIRTWVFFGDRERCRRFLSPHPLVKGRGMIPDEPVPVPDSIRAQRERLGFDFGKFDFVIHGEDGVLLDANSTPGAPPRGRGIEIDAVLADQAGGLASVIAARSLPAV